MFFSSLQMRRCTSAPRYTTTTCTFYLYITPGDEFVFDKLGSGDASDSDWTSWSQLLPYNKECVCLPVVKHSNTGRLRQEGTLHFCAITRTPNWHGDQRKRQKGFFPSQLLNLTRLKWTFNQVSLINRRTSLQCSLRYHSCECYDLIITHVL